MPIALHYKENKQNFSKLLYILLSLCLFYGWYKNGLSYVFLGRMSFSSACLLLIYPLVSLLINILYNKISKKKWYHELYEGLFLSLIIPPNSPYLLFILLTLGYFFIKKIRLKTPVSRLLLFKVCLGVFCLLFSISYENQIESSVPYFYDVIDLFFGRAVGNFGTTSILLLFLIYLLFASDFYYKKELPIYTIVSFGICAFFYSAIIKDFSFLSTFLNSHIWVVAIFFVPENKYSPAIGPYKNIYAILIGILSFIFMYLLNIPDGAYYVVFILELLWLFLSKILIFKK